MTSGTTLVKNLSTIACHCASAYRCVDDSNFYRQLHGKLANRFNAINHTAPIAHQGISAVHDLVWHAHMMRNKEISKQGNTQGKTRNDHGVYNVFFLCHA